MLQIRNEIITSLIENAIKNAPIEACGYLAEKDNVIGTILPLTNIDNSEEHFSFDPKEQFDSVRKIRAEGMKLRAVYHSHPASPARPSEEDIRLAYDPNISYVIVSLYNNEKTVKSYIIKNGIVQEEEIVVI